MDPFGGPNPSRRDLLRLYRAQERPNADRSGFLAAKQVPASLRNVYCASAPTTDVITTCSFEIALDDFTCLLTGWHFAGGPANGGSYSYSSGPKVGIEFPVSTQFTALNPPEFKQGGSVIVVADLKRSRVQVDYHEE